MVALACNLSTQEVEKQKHHEFEASLGGLCSKILSQKKFF